MPSEVEADRLGASQMLLLFFYEPCSKVNKQKKGAACQEQASFTSQGGLTRPGVIGFVDDLHLQEPDGDQSRRVKCHRPQFCRHVFLMHTLEQSVETSLEMMC